MPKELREEPSPEFTSPVRLLSGERSRPESPRGFCGSGTELHDDSIPVRKIINYRETLRQNFKDRLLRAHFFFANNLQIRVAIDEAQKVDTLRRMQHIAQARARTLSKEHIQSEARPGSPKPGPLNSPDSLELRLQRLFKQEIPQYGEETDFQRVVITETSEDEENNETLQVNS